MTLILNFSLDNFEPPQKLSSQPIISNSILCTSLAIRTQISEYENKGLRICVAKNKLMCKKDQTYGP